MNAGLRHRGRSLGQLHAHHLHLVGVVARIHAREPEEAVREERRADGEHDGERGFDDEEAEAQPAGAACVHAGADRALAAAERLKQIDPRAAQRRNESGDDRGRERRGEAEREHGGVDRHGFEAREALGRGERQQPNQRPRQRQAGDAAGGDSKRLSVSSCRRGGRGWRRAPSES